MCNFYMNRVIIHISGPSGAGKTTLGNKLKQLFKDKIIVKDLDDLRDEFIKKRYSGEKWKYIDEEGYQQYIDNFIKRKTKPIVFVGLNDNNFGKDKNIYYQLHSAYNFYIDIEDDVVLLQKATRFFEEIVSDKMAMQDLLQNNELFLKKITAAIKSECSLKNMIEQHKRWEKHYKQKRYKFMTRNNILKAVVNLLRKY